MVYCRLTAAPADVQPVEHQRLPRRIPVTNAIILLKVAKDRINEVAEAIVDF